MKVATFNVNSIRARLPNVLRWIEAVKPDVLMMQEIKVVNDDFPRQELENAGYTLFIHGQKSYNGVAIATRQNAREVNNSILLDDALARYLEIEIEGVHYINIYAPNGNPVESEKFPYKLKWLEALLHRAKALLDEETPFLIGGDFNIIPEDEDCYDPAAWADDALFQPEARRLWRRLKNLGLTDAYRALHSSEKEAYTFWDYQAGRWQRDEGLRIDHLLLSPQAADCLDTCEIDRAPRAKEKPSDHTPIWCSLNL